MILVLLANSTLQSTYGPAVPPPLPSRPAPADPAPPGSLAGSEAVLKANGLSEAGLRALRDVPVPTIARGATRAAQCAVEQLSGHDPLPLAELTNALQERDATAAAQAQATTQYLVAALQRLAPADQRILLSVLGTGGATVGGPPPPRPALERPDSPGERRGPGGPSGPAGRGGPGMGGGGAGGPPPGGERMAGGGGRPPAPPGERRQAGPREASPCERMLGD